MFFRASKNSPKQRQLLISAAYNLYRYRSHRILTKRQIVKYTHVEYHGGSAAYGFVGDSCQNVKIAEGGDDSWIPQEHPMLGKCDMRYTRGV